MQKYLYKICFTMKPITNSFGGGNQFLNNIIKYLEDRSAKIVFDLIDDDIDIIFMMDPRKLTLNKITVEMVKEYKLKNPNVIIIHRINDSDKPRNQKNILDPIILECLNKVDDVAIFVSEFTRKYYQQLGYTKLFYEILNGCDINTFLS